MRAHKGFLFLPDASLIGLDHFGGIDLEAGEERIDVRVDLGSQFRSAAQNEQEFNSVDEVVGARVDDGEGFVVGVEDPIFAPRLPRGEAELETTRIRRPGRWTRLTNGGVWQSIFGHFGVVDLDGAISQERVVGDATASVLEGVGILLDVVPSSHVGVQIEIRLRRHLRATSVQPSDDLSVGLNDEKCRKKGHQKRLHLAQFCIKVLSFKQIETTQL